MLRTCASCRQSEDLKAVLPFASPLLAGALVRWVLTDEGEVIPDLVGRLGGRGAWLHSRPECLMKLRSSLSRSFRQEVKTTDQAALVLLSQSARHRVKQLIGSARRRNLLVYGKTEVENSWEHGRAFLLLVAEDAAAAADSWAVREAVAQGRARIWSKKDDFGRLFARPAVGVVALVDESLARSVFGAIAMSLLVQDIGPGPEPTSKILKLPVSDDSKLLEKDD